MKRAFAVIAFLILALALAAGTTLAVHNPIAAGPIYTVTQVQSGLARHPQAWIGRTVLVRGTILGWAGTNGPGTAGASALPCFAPCFTPPAGWPAPHLVLLEGTVTGAYPDLLTVVAQMRPHTLVLHVSSPVPASPSPLTFLRSLPVVGSWIPVPRQLIYRVRLLPSSPTVAPCRLALQACDDAILMGTQPAP